jgi:integrase
MVRQIREYDTDDGKRFRVRYRLGGVETSETFRRAEDAEMFRDMLGDSKDDRVGQALAWLSARQQVVAEATLPFSTWFEHYVDQLTGVSPRTRGDYRSMKRRYLTSLDRLPLPLITRTHVTGIVNRMDSEGRSPKTIKSTINMLSTCLGLAIDEGHIATNPCKRVRLPTQQIGGVEARFLTHKEFAALVAATPLHYKPLVVFLFGTGLRWSEATALQARHVDIANGTVRVEQAWKRVPGESFRLGPPKTAKSKRTVNAATMALAAVQPLLRKPNDFVFTTASGGVVRHANFFTNVWQPACERAGLEPPPRIHDGRHSHASWLLSDGQSLEAVQDQLGHESILTTRKVYGHLLPALGVAIGRSASAALDRALPDGWAATEISATSVE